MSDQNATGADEGRRNARESGGPDAIDLSAAGLRFDDVTLGALSVSALTEWLGAPRIERPNPPTDAGGPPRSGWAVWDECGIRVATPDGEEARELSIQLSDDPERSARISDEARGCFPARSFPGRFTIDGRPPIEAVPEEALRKARAFLDAEAGDWECALFLNSTECGEIGRMEMPEWLSKAETGELADIVRGAADPFREAAVVPPTPAPAKRPVRKPSGRWKLPTPSEPVLEFASFPFKLAIVQELMYGQGLIEPRFDVHDFAQDRGARSFDPSDFGEKMIPAVRTWFRKLPVPARLAASVETLVLDGGDDIYLQLIPQWDGEDDSFMIASLTDADLAPFTALRSVEDIGGFLGRRARAALEARGIAVE